MEGTDLNASLVAFTGTVDDFMYTWILVFLLVFVGIYFTIRTGFVQIRYIKDMFKNITEKKHVEGEKSISSFQAMMVSTASRVGTGNIAGVATAVATGGPGAVFWMWVMCIIGSASAFIESTLAQIWKVKAGEGEFRGGPAYYIQQALHSRGWGIVFAIALILCFAFGFNGLQAFNLTSSLEYYIPDYATNGVALGVGIALVVFTAFCIFGGTHLISIISSIIVPIMAVAYILVALWTAVTHVGIFPAVVQTVMESAFSAQSFAGGLAGSVLMLGIKRGLFSNEAGMGSAPNAAATASVSHPCKQGLIQSLSVYIDTLLICTCTAVIVLTFWVDNGGPAVNAAGEVINGMGFVQLAVANAVGEWGIHFITFAIFAFAFSSIIGNYFYAESNILFIKNSKVVLFVFRICCLAVVLYGCLNSFDLAWNLADIFMGFMAIINLVVILMIGKWALAALKDYSEQRNAGKDPVFISDNIKGMPKTECWHVEDVKNIGDQPIHEYLADALTEPASLV